MRILSVQTKRSLIVVLILIATIQSLNIESIEKNSIKISSQRLLQQVPTTWDWSMKANLTSVKSEGYCGASEAFATVAFYETDVILNLNQTSTIDLSEQYLIACDPLNSNCSNKASVAEMIDLVTQKSGIPLETKVPFDAFNLRSKDICKTKEFFTVPKTYRKSFYNLGDQEVLKKEVLKKPVIAVVCGEELVNYRPGLSEDSKILRCSPRFSSPNQAVLIIGYTERYWIIRNSWGEKWGMKGYGYISRKSDQNCCIGREIHTTKQEKLSGTTTVSGCAKFDDEGFCLRCETGKFLQPILGSSGPNQACVPCSVSNCQQCADYSGECKYCIKGYGINETSGNCESSTIDNCNRFVNPGYCNQCRKGFLLSRDHDNCFLNCAVDNCASCESGQCDQCQAGFKLSTVNGTQICQKNACSVSNCDLCDQNGTCVQCSVYYQLSNAAVCTKPCSIADCLACKSTDWYCSECVVGKSFNYTSSVCESFSIANCGMHLSGKCYECRVGYRFNDQRTVCSQACDVLNCGQCKDKDPMNCLTCSDGYTLANSTSCLPNSCSIQNCTACKGDNSSCITCVTPYHIYNSTSNKCELKCSLENCELCKPTDTVCGKCKLGYLPEYKTGKCIQANFEHCRLVANNSQRLECWECEPKYISTTETWQSCKLDCQDPLCEECEFETLSICSRCTNGYQLIFNHRQNRLQCEQIPSLMPKCILVSQNQTYCFTCQEYHYYNFRTLSCQPNTQNCPQNCELCPAPGSLTPGCKCVQGFVYDIYQEKCVSNTFNASCVQATIYGSQQICIKCEEEVLLASNYLSCMAKCTVPNCIGCYEGNNGFCEQCQMGFFINALWKCDPCNISGCKSCVNSRQCTECQPGFELSLDGTVCRLRNCSFNNDLDGVSCSCNYGTGLAQPSSSCQGCQENCRWCDLKGCVECERGYFLNSGTCTACMPNCLKCINSISCDSCEATFFFEPSQGKCISAGSNRTFFVDGQRVIQCGSGCLRCQKSGICSECMQGYSISLVTQQKQCIPCQKNCRSCLFNLPQVCLSCINGYFLQGLSCQSCSDQNCLQCRSSPLTCTKCILGYFPSNNTCTQCSKGCFDCNFRGECMKCNHGFTLSAAKTCVKCVGNCSSCNSLQLNQCLTRCNQTFFLFNGTCKLCPETCTMCQADNACLQCKSGFLLREGNCVLPCLEGCYQCDPKNNQQCTKCFVGYKLSPSNICEPDLSCNQMSNCTICPKGFILLDGKCMILPQMTNCRQSSTFNLTQCINCEVGFYVINKTCAPCAQSCKVCSQQSLCSLCSDGYFLIPTENRFNGRCLKCADMCKTCKERANLCISCQDGFELTVDQKCLRKDKIQIRIKLDTAMDAIYGLLQTVRQDLAGLMGDNYKGQADLVQITNLVSGSVIVDAQLNVPEKEDPANIYTNVKDKLLTSYQIAGLNLMSVEKIDLQSTPLSTVNQNNQDDKKVLIIVLSTVIPVVGIAAIFASFYIYKKYFKPSSLQNEHNQVNEEKKPSQKLDSHLSKKFPMFSKLPPLTPKHEKLNPTKVDQILMEYEDQKTFDIILKSQNAKKSRETNFSEAVLKDSYSKVQNPCQVISPVASEKEKDSQVDQNQVKQQKQKTLKEMIIEDEADHRQSVVKLDD